MPVCWLYPRKNIGVTSQASGLSFHIEIHGFHGFSDFHGFCGFYGFCSFHEFCRFLRFQFWNLQFLRILQFLYILRVFFTKIRGFCNHEVQVFDQVRSFKRKTSKPTSAEVYLTHCNLFQQGLYKEKKQLQTSSVCSGLSLYCCKAHVHKC